MTTTRLGMTTDGASSNDPELFIDPEQLPTPLAIVARRVHNVDPDNLSEVWLKLSYFAEIHIKLTTLVLLGGLRANNPQLAKKEEYALVRASGLGTWEESILSITGHAQSGYINTDLQPLVSWLVQRRTKSKDPWLFEAAEAANAILAKLDVPADLPKKLTVRHVLTRLTRIRNKTKAHGAVGREFWAFANPLYNRTLSILTSNNPIVGGEWYHLSVRKAKNNVRAVALQGVTARSVLSEQAETLRPKVSGLHIRPHKQAGVYHLGCLIEQAQEFQSFLIANGSYNTTTGTAELLCYATGTTRQIEFPQYREPPAPLPRSATEGSERLEVYSSTFGNFPKQISGYVNRPQLESELLRLLRDRNHSFITLHGRGGIGKTSLALHALHKLDAMPYDRFDHLMWFSARDLDLRPDRLLDVRRAVSDLESIARLAGRLLDNDDLDIDGLARVLQDPGTHSSEGMLLVFDNFETLDDPREVHRFLDTHTHAPNKILITSRERAFRGDYPIEVQGLELEEARELLTQESQVLGIDRIVEDDRIENIHEYTDGHAYVMRVLLGEIAEQGRWVPLKSLVPRRSDLLNTVFERSFNKLSDDARWAFILVASWRSYVSELALFVIMSMREFDAEQALSKCTRLSLLRQHELADGTYCYSCPELARLFAKKKLKSDPDRLLLEEDLAQLRQFGVLSDSDMTTTDTTSIIDKFIARYEERVLDSDDETTIERFDSILSRVAEVDGRAWPGVAHFRRRFSKSREDVAYAHRRAVEEYPTRTDLWIARAEVAAEYNDDAVRMSSLITAVETDPRNRDLVRDVAFELCKYVNDHKQDIPLERRGVYLASVRSRMVVIADDLDATGLSRLAWLYLLEDNAAEAWKYANEGLARESTNKHCLRLVERIERESAGS